jgi:adenylate cyclase
LGVAATIGRSFTVAVLAQASGQSTNELVAALDELWQRRIIREQGINAYDFSHDKLRDVAYRELSPIQRRTLHQRVAIALEHVHAADLDPLSAQLAAHYEQAGCLRPAFGYYERAALAAQRVFAHEQAIQLLHKGLLLLPMIAPDRERVLRELAMQTELGASLVALKGYGAAEVLSAYQRARSLCAQLEQPDSPPILRGLALTHIVRAESQQAYQLGQQIRVLAQHEQNSVLLVEAEYVQSVALIWQGQFLRAQAHLQTALAHYDPQQTHTHLALYAQDPQVVCLIRLAGNLWLLGYPEQSNRIAEQARMRARELAHPFTLTYVGYYDTHRHVVARSAQAALAAAEATITLCREHQVAYWHSLTTICHGWANGRLGALADGIAQIHKGIDHRAAEGTWVSEPLYRALLAELYVQAGEVTRAQATLEAGIAAAHARGEHWYTADLYRIQGDLLLLQGNAAAGEQAFQRALSTARSQHAKSLELRAAISLTRLWQNHGRIQDAQQLLTPLYNWFSEGFDTPDLIAARNLLDMLAN